MTQTLRRLAALLALLALTGCGGRTGLAVFIEVPAALEPQLDFDSIRVQVDAEAASVAEQYVVSPTTPKPYIVYVFVNETPHYQANVRVELFQKGSIKRSQLVPVDFVEGEIVPVNVVLPQ
jgi:hypothetical protein